MARKAASMQFSGIRETMAMLGEQAPKEALSLLRSTVHGTAGEIRKGMRAEAPKLTRRLEKAIKTKRRRGTPTTVVSDVTIAREAFYWRFFEYGTVDSPARPFIVPVVEKIRPRLPQIFHDQFGRKLEQALRRKAKRAAARVGGGV